MAKKAKAKLITRRTKGILLHFSNAIRPEDMQKIADRISEALGIPVACVNGTVCEIVPIQEESEWE